MHKANGVQDSTYRLLSQEPVYGEAEVCSGLTNGSLFIGKTLQYQYSSQFTHVQTCAHIHTSKLSQHSSHLVISTPCELCISLFDSIIILFYVKC